MPVKPKVAPIELKNRLQASLKQAPRPVDLNPTAPPPPKEPEYIPELQEVIADPAQRKLAASLISTALVWKQQISEAKKALDPITTKLKTILGNEGIGKCCYDGARLNYYNSPRSSISKEKLLECGVSPLTIIKCTVVGDSYTLRITLPGEKEGDE